jgi:hypothetical protein
MPIPSQDLEYDNWNMRVHAVILSGIAKEVLGSAMFGRMTNPLPKAAPTRILTTDVSIGDRSKSQRIDFADQSISPPQIRS